jgi:hypothetical protein
MLSKPAWQPPLSWEVLTLLLAAALIVAASQLFAFLHPGAPFFPARLTRTFNRLSRRNGKALEQAPPNSSVVPQHIE